MFIFFFILTFNFFLSILPSSSPPHIPFPYSIDPLSLSLPLYLSLSISPSLSLPLSVSLSLTFPLPSSCLSFLPPVSSPLPPFLPPLQLELMPSGDRRRSLTALQYSLAAADIKQVTRKRKRMNGRREGKGRLCVLTSVLLIYDSIFFCFCSFFSSSLLFPHVTLSYINSALFTFPHFTSSHLI
jgi:hypothetical protein